MARVELKGVTKRYPDAVALQPIDLTVTEGEFVTLLGPSGCGKTTTLRILAGFVEPSAGRVLFDGSDVTRLPPQKRGIGMVFQDFALFPHLTIAENVAFALRERRVPGARIRERVAELLALIKLPEIAERFPSEISGGQQQRVAFARAIAHPPSLLLMDEPLGALDLKLREAMQAELRQLQRQLAITTVFVTHDQSEAMSLSDRIAVMEKGRIAQIGTAREIYEAPRSRFVADFIGQINLLPAELLGREGGFAIVRGCGAVLRAQPPAEPPAGGSPAGSTSLGVRPQHVAIANGAPVPDFHNRLEGVVLSQSFNGNLVHFQVECRAEGGATRWTVEARPGEHAVEDGAAVTLHWAPDRSLVLAE